MGSSCVLLGGSDCSIKEKRLPCLIHMPNREGYLSRNTVLCITGYWGVIVRTTSFFELNRIDSTSSTDVSFFFQSVMTRTRPRRPLLHLGFLGKYLVSLPGLLRAAEDMGVRSSLQHINAKPEHAHYVSKMRGFKVGVFVVLDTDHAVWKLSEHELHERCRCLTVPELLLLDRQT